jgi:signal transduction histidine kinase
VRRTSLLLLGIGVLGLLIGIIGAAWLARRITTPLQKLVEGTKHISRGDFSLQIDIHSQDEIGNLARSFNEMSEELQLLQRRMEEANKRLIQVEKLASIGHISAGIAHEIRNPLTAVKLNIQKLSENQNLDEADRVNLEISQEGIAQIEKFIKELLNYARVSELNLDWFDMDQIIDGSVKMIADSLELKGVTVERRYGADLPQVRVDADKVRQVVLNILRNSLEAMQTGGKITICVQRTDTASGPRLRTEISDDGRGVPRKDWENVFEPFYTTKASGIGLGLAIARKILEQHSGTIRVTAQEGAGSCFEILLPCEDQP